MLNPQGRNNSSPIVYSVQSAAEIELRQWFDVKVVPLVLFAIHQGLCV